MSSTSCVWATCGTTWPVKRGALSAAARTADRLRSVSAKEKQKARVMAADRTTRPRPCHHCAVWVEVASNHLEPADIYSCSPAGSHRYIELRFAPLVLGLFDRGTPPGVGSRIYFVPAD